MASDDFNRGSLGSNWTIANGALTIDSSSYLIGNSGGDHNWGVWNADTFGADQFSQVKIHNLYAAEGQNGVFVRALNSGRTSYIFSSHTPDGVGAWRLYRVISAGYTFLASGTSGANVGDILRIEVENISSVVTISCYGGAAGTTLLTTDAGTNPYEDTDGNQLLTGQPGVAIYNNHSTNLLDDWSGGDLGEEPPEPGIIQSASNLSSNFRSRPRVFSHGRIR